MGELQVSAIAGQTIKLNDRFKHARRRHALVGPGGKNALMGGESRDQQVAHAPNRGQRRLIASVAIVLEKPDHVVGMRPDIPIGTRKKPKPLRRKIDPKVAIRFLRTHQLRSHSVELLFERGVARVGPGQCGGMHPLAHVLADPFLFAGLLQVASQKRIGVHYEKPAPFVCVDPVPKPTLDPDLG